MASVLMLSRKACYTSVIYSYHRSSRVAGDRICAVAQDLNSVAAAVRACS